MKPRKLTKLLAGLLALCVLLPGCSTAGASSAGTDSAPAADESSVERTLNVVVAKPSVVEDMNTNETSKWLEKKTGIKVNYDQLPQESISEKVALMLSGGDLPDIFFSCGITSEQMNQYGIQDQVLIPLDDLINDMPNLQEAMEPFKEQGGFDLIREVDDHIYSFPTFNPCFHCSRALKMWLNDDWMQALKLEYPTTTDEFRAVLQAFKDKDPNGNGLQDEIPLTGDTDGWYTQSYYFLMESFLPINPYQQGFGADDNGKVVNLTTDERFREALRYLNGLYQDGLMYEGTLTQKNDQLKKLVDNPDIDIVGATTAGFGGQFSTDIGGERYRQYRPLSPLKGPEGVQYCYSAPQYPTDGDCVITKDCKDPKIAAEWADALYTGEACATVFNGVEGTAWRYAEEGEVGMDGKPALWTALIPYGADVGSTHNNCWTQMGIYNFSAAWRSGQTVDPDVDPYSAEGMEYLLFKTTKEQYDQYNIDKYALPTLRLSEEENTTVSTLRTEWNNYYTEMLFNFISGAWNLESDWDNHIENTNSVYAMSTMLQNYQAAYDRQK